MILALCRITALCPSWVKSESVVPEVRLPLYPRERTSWATAATSEKCQTRTLATANPALRFDPRSILLTPRCQQDWPKKRNGSWSKGVVKGVTGAKRVL
jgi:hypothetical protein